MSRKREPWGLIIQDDDRKQYAFTGVIEDDMPWNERVTQEQKKGRNVRCFSHKPSNDHNLPEWEQRLGLARVTVEALLDPPEDDSTTYKGALPQYASRADRKRVVRILCRGRCCTTRWAQLNQDYPGDQALKEADHGVYSATCLRCGYRAVDNYNWMR